jgi:hypothetical protein
MGCDNNSSSCGTGAGNACCMVQRVLKGVLEVAKIAALVSLTLVLLDVHTGLKSQVEGMQAQQAMMMNAAAAANNGPAK